MMFFTHLAFALLSGLFSLKFVNPSNKYLFLIIVCLVSLFPDLDNYKSKTGKKFGFISKIIEFVFGHRGLFHSIHLPLLLFCLFYFFNYKLAAFAILIGYLSHLLIDGLTVSGVNLLNPLLKLNINGFVKTGGVLEYLIFILLLIANILYFIWFLK